MRIQHNIMAMNAYRNYNTNTSALSKNLEKLSSGYKINRAGDDAAGLAISEKMRAQITGLNAAQKNVKDGISLIKTGEGAMQEIQDMLNRMDYLATQSANGTYDDPVDRLNLQKEVDALKTEINRIADSANFNGINLLDGSMSNDGGSVSINNFKTSLVTDEAAAVAGKYTVTLTGGDNALKAGDKLNITIGLTNGKSANVELTVSSDKNSVVTANGTKYNLAATSKITQVELATIIKNETKGNLANDFSISTNGGAVDFTAKVAGTGSPQIGSLQINKVSDGQVSTTVISKTATITTQAKDKEITFKSSAITVLSSSSQKLEDCIFTINGQKFVVAKDTKSVALITDKSVNVIKAAAPNTHVANELSQKTGLKITFDGTNTFKVASGSAKTGSALRLQIGDTSDSYNQMQVSIGDMHTTAMGIEGIDIGTQDGAASAISVIKSAINYVSGIRGDLGALQNRLEHTQKNLSVMAENIQDAESTIRDTDVAEEMMSYTKNNILIQSAQAMLAQANAVPQGVLQLLG